MSQAKPQVAIERLGGLVAERAGPRSTALAHDDRDLLVHVDVVELEAGELGPPHAGVEEEPDDRRVAAGVEVGPGTGVEDRLELLVAQDRRRLLGHDRRRHPLHR